MTATATSTHRLLGPAPTTPLPRLSAAELIQLAERAGLTGRGGAGFPTARKLAAVASAGSAPVVVGNAMEGEHLSHKDAVLLRVSPGLVLDGLELVARALGARRTVLAVSHRSNAGPVTEAANGRHVEVLPLTAGFVGGQESALVNRINGRAGVPADRLRPVWRSGVDGRPTLVSNAETFARLALLARHGDAALPGTFLVSVTGSARDTVARSGVHEVPWGSTVRDVLAAAGTDASRLRGVLVGGYHGTWTVDLDRPLSASIVHVLDQGHCPLRVSADIAAYLARESAEQCGPCVNGLPALAAALDRLARGTGDPAEVERLRALVDGRGACAHPDGTARLVASTMRTFGDHVADHLDGQCSR